MVTRTLTLRAAELSDLSAVDRLLMRSYARLLAPDYPPSSIVLALPRFARAQPELLSSGRYFVAEDVQGRIMAAGGWSLRDPSGGSVSDKLAHVRHVATDPEVARQGVGRMLMQRVMAAAGGEGIEAMDCLSTRTAVPFYLDLGFKVVRPQDLILGPGIGFPLVRMLASLRET